MVKISQRLVKNSRSVFPGTNQRRFITIHETGNYRKGANAKMHAQLQINGFTASFHWQVDDKEAIQSFLHTARCWHAGDGAGSGNYNSIGIEICVNSDGDYQKAIRNAAELVQKIMRDEGIPLKNVVQHNHWSGKDCPRHLRKGDKGINWHQFISMVQGVEVEQVSNSKSSTTVKVPSTSTQTAKLTVDGYWGPATTKALQRYFNTPVDGVISGQPSNESTRNIPSASHSSKSIVDGMLGSQLIRAMQRYYKSGTVDGLISSPSMLIRAMQRKYGTTVDGVVSKPSLLVIELQKRLNKGKL